MKITISISVGEAIDKLSILYIKLKMIKDEDKLFHVQKEYNELKVTLQHLEYSGFLKRLISINEKMWIVNEKRKTLISNKQFDEEYLELTKKESTLNDDRFLIKNEINEFFGSEIKEKKSYI